MSHVSSVSLHVGIMNFSHMCHRIYYVSSVSLHVGIMNSIYMKTASFEGFQRVSARRNYELNTLRS